MDISTKTIMELKAIAYDLIGSIENLQKNLAIVNQAIEQKSKEEARVEPKVEVETPSKAK